MLVKSLKRLLLKVEDDSVKLDGMKILITRPRESGERLASALESVDGQPILFPLIDIQSVQVTPKVLDAIKVMDIAIFISPNAATSYFGGQFEAKFWPSNIVCYAVGNVTADTLRYYGVAVTAFPKMASSEGLLGLCGLRGDRVYGKKIVIFRGENGLRMLGDCLRSRGASVMYCESYKRVRPKLDPDPVNFLGRFQGIDIIVATSVELLVNMVEIFDPLPDSGWLRDVPVAVPSGRVASHVESLGWRVKPIITRGATDDAILSALLGWRRAEEIR